MIAFQNRKYHQFMIDNFSFGRSFDVFLFHQDTFS